MTHLLKLPSFTNFKFKKIEVEFTYKQSVLWGLGLGFGTAALKVLAFAGVFCVS
ncbi:hypothetical protein [Comamonas thiooxydans]|uniref:Uncharacterized protein n=1 Tax=Comamonas thiooxydans TaxID=363952 RepID=A0A0E3BA73_9BURK|nr:hypothetical protein [Comamonas thiooxydans]KGG87388.1 hypothetical protein P245_20200 [Comamonas thiooxydans]KGH23599.1 hypothetical protein P606_11830 [Comamonas thiooxydans]